MDYIIVPTSNSAYQSWQCRLLNWSRKKVKQTGKLIFLMCEDEMGKDRPFDTYSDAEVIRLPNWGVDWENSEPKSKRGEKYWWGAIPNKYESVRWLAQSGRIRDEDTLLFLDPDMIFTEAVDEKPVDDEFIAQRFIHYYPMPPWSNDAVGDGIMYPFVVNGKTLKKIVDDYKSGCEQIKRNAQSNGTQKWESEMWGLDYAVKKNGLKISYRENLGFCTAWRPNGDTEISSIIHFPNEILNPQNQRIWFKQDYTFRSDMPIPITEARNSLDRKLLLNVAQERTDHIYYTKWDFSNIFKSYDGSKGYAILHPYPGGFNNIRMSLELAVCIAYLTNKTLVLPPKYNMYLLKDSMGMEDFFDTDDLGVKTIKLEEFAKIKNIEPNFEEAAKIATVWSEPPERVINFAKIEPNDAFRKGRQVVNFPTDPECILLDRTLLGAWYQTIHSSKDEELKRLVARHVHYRTELFDIAFEGVNWLGDRNYYAIHVRRNDFQYKNLFISGEDLLNNVRDQIPQSARLYIATDCEDKSYFEPLMKHYRVFFYEDVVNGSGLKCPHYNFIPIIEQLICTRAVAFIGNDYSTLSSYIYRMRGYMSDIEDKKFRINTMPYSEEEQWGFLECRRYIGNWAREFAESWDLEPKKIFVSLASYCDQQLIPTIRDLLARANNPSRVVLGVHLQNTHEALEELKSYQFANIRIIHTLPEDSMGVVWARERIKRELFTDEDYFLQVDSHSRFKDNWDGILIRQLNSLPSGKTLISTYPNEFKVSDTENTYFRISTNAPLKILGFSGNTGNTLRPINTDALKDFELVESKWIGAGFTFAPAEWVKTIISCTDMRFKGEEDYLFFSSYLNGWTVWLPSEATVWHSYEGNADYRKQNTNAIPDFAIDRIDELLFSRSTRRVRSISELENYLGLKFRKKDPTIFVSIASYRDHQLIQTVKNCLAKAINSDRIRIGICWQYDETEFESLASLDGDHRIQIHKVRWDEVQGSVCWARALIQKKFFNDEDYYLQIDSHTQFDRGWDVELINMYEKTSRDKAVISVGPSYYYDLTAKAALPHEKHEPVEFRDNMAFDTELKIQKLDAWDKDSRYFMYGFLPAPDLSKPIPARHISAAYIFTIGQWVRDVPYDENLYFHGEEGSLAIRSFTNGYDLFNPNKMLLWHLKYYFPDRLRHWNTFDSTTVSDFNARSLARYHKIVCAEGPDPELGVYGLGSARSVAEWERYSGISFRYGLAHDSVKAGNIPNPVTVEDHESWIRGTAPTPKPKVMVFTWAISPNLTYAQTTCSRMVDTAKKYGIHVHFMGVGEKYECLKQKLKVMKYNVQGVTDPDTIVICVDGADVLFNENLSTIIDKFIAMETEIVIAAEKYFTYQWPEYKDNFDRTTSPYRYVNSGTYVGRAGSLIKMIDEALAHSREKETENDQGLIGIWVHNNLHNPSKVKMDTNCELMWVTAGDWEVVDESAKQSSIIRNPNTNTRPSMIHVVGLQSYEAVYDRTHKSIMSGQ